MIIKTCLECKTRFEAFQNKRKYCGRTCFGKAHSRNRMGANNPAWKGSDVSYKALHDWVKWHFPKSSSCDWCGVQTDRLDLSNRSGRYLRDVADWEWLCRRCHMVYDGRQPVTCPCCSHKFKMQQFRATHGVYGAEA